MQQAIIALPLVVKYYIIIICFIVLIMWYIAEFTPGAYVPSDLDNFGKAYAPDIVGKRPMLVSIDGGQYHFQCVLSKNSSNVL